MIHSKVDTATPGGAIVAAVPETIGMSFTKPIRLARVDLLLDDAPAERLELGGQTGFATEFTLPVSGQGAESYRIEWRGLGNDGHVLQGSFSFQLE